MERIGDLREKVSPDWHGTNRLDRPKYYRRHGSGHYKMHNSYYQLLFMGWPLELLSYSKGLV